MNSSAEKPGWRIRAFRPRWVRRLLILGGGLVLLVAGFYAEEDWRGRRDWNRYREVMEARGEHLDFRAHIPKAVPDVENFAETPIPKSWMQAGSVSSMLTNDIYAHVADHIVATNLAKERGRRHFVDLVAWQLASASFQAGRLKPRDDFETEEMDPAARLLAAADILEGMRPSEAYFEELRADSARKYARFPDRYDTEDPATILLPHLSKIKAVCVRMNLQACAELEVGQTDKALADVKLALYLADTIKDEPFLISYLVRVACFQIANQAVWEGLAEHRWTDSQLREIQVRFAGYDFLGDVDLSLKSERVFGIREVDLLKKRGLGWLDDAATIANGADFDEIGQTTLHKQVLNMFGRIMPDGWYVYERLNYCVAFDGQLKGVIDLAAQRVHPGISAANYAILKRQLPAPSPRTSLSSILRHQATVNDPAGIEKVVVKAAAAQTAANQVALACALERFRLVNGRFPETLAELAPGFIERLPHDLITGDGYKYRRTLDGQFILYSVGWNEKDDGGVAGKSLFDPMEGDWIWEYPVK